MTTRRLGRKTGPKPKFSRSDVINAAFALGMDRFTLSGVAAKLGVAPSAVYRLFDGRDVLVDACLATVAQRLSVDFPPEVSWQEILRSWADQTWQLCESYLGLSITLYQFPGAFSHIEPQVRQLMELLVIRGFSQELAIFALDFIGDTVVSTHIGVTTYRQTDEQGRTGLEIAYERFKGTPLLQPEVSWTQRGFLDKKLEFIIEGIAQRLG